MLVVVTHHCKSAGTAVKRPEFKAQFDHWNTLAPFRKNVLFALQNIQYPSGTLYRQYFEMGRGTGCISGEEENLSQGIRIFESRRTRTLPLLKWVYILRSRRAVNINVQSSSIPNLPNPSRPIIAWHTKGTLHGSLEHLQDYNLPQRVQNCKLPRQTLHQYTPFWPADSKTRENYISRHASKQTSSFTRRKQRNTGAEVGAVIGVLFGQRGHVSPVLLERRGRSGVHAEGKESKQQ